MHKTQEDVNRAIGIKIRFYRKQLNLTQEQLASATVLSNDYISRLELGKENPTIGTLVLICQCLNIDIESLFASAE